MAITKAKTNYGTVTGIRAANPRHSKFLGIPFAKPPVGILRFAPPQKPDKWGGELVCDHFAPSCMQRIREDETEYFSASEDCLYLNIYTPAESENESLPVMVWIYGGGFNGGHPNHPLLDGEAFNKRGAILVTFAYRCGPLGFFAHPEIDKRFGSSTNLGLLDQIAALEWVQENIAAFGGDPKRVLLFGQSAGGLSTRMHLTSPRSKGLFSRAILQSGGGLNEADPVRPKEEMSQICISLLEYLGWSFEELMQKDAMTVILELGRAMRESRPGQWAVFQPFVDGVTLTDVPGKLIAEGRYVDIPIISGSVPGDAQMFIRPIARKIIDNMDYLRAFSYSPGVAWARHQIRTGRKPIYSYYLDRTQPEPGSTKFAPLHHAPLPFGNECPHESDIAYVFGTIGVKESFGTKFEEFDHYLSDAMCDYWVSFAANGVPDAPDLPAWPAYTSETPFVMHFSDKGIIAEDLISNDQELRAIEYAESHPGLTETTDGLL